MSTKEKILASEIDSSKITNDRVLELYTAIKVSTEDFTVNLSEADASINSLAKIIDAKFPEAIKQAQKEAPEPEPSKTEKDITSIIKKRPKERERSTESTEDALVKYDPFSKASFSVGAYIPSAMATEIYKSLNQVEQEFGNLDLFVQNRLEYKSKEELFKALSAEQVDSVALSIYNIERGEATIVGDQTGLGKGRTAAAVIRYAIKQGLKPVFMTLTDSLFTDIYRDLKDIGSPDYKPFFVNANVKVYDIDKSGKKVAKHSSLDKKKQDKLFDKGEVPKGYDFVCTTYSQFQNESQARLKTNFIKSVAINNILILDESHTPSGANSNQGKVIQDCVRVSKGVTFLSATFAKKPENLPIYSLRTVMSESALTSDELTEVMIKGGIALQEVISSQLVASGQMIRRERRSEGATVDYLYLGYDPDKTDAENKAVKDRHVAISDAVTGLIRKIIRFQEVHVGPVVKKLSDVAVREGARIAGSESKAGIDSPPVFSGIFNLIFQLVFTLKAKDVAEKAIQLVKEGKSVIIACHNTMEAALKNMDAKVGDVLKNTDFSVVLERRLLSTMTVYETDFTGEKNKGQLEVSDLELEGQRSFYEILDNFQTTLSGISISPLDDILDTVERAGIRTAELTGRKLVLEYDKNGVATVANKRGGTKVDIARRFNDGEVKVLIVNRSGSTGISLHASEKFKNQDKRAMIIAQPQLDVNIEVQMRGRIDRVGQVKPPEYLYISSSIPSELRFMMMLKKKLKSLDANTSSNQKQSKKLLDGVDFLNKYGDNVVGAYIAENPKLGKMLGISVSDSEDNLFVTEDVASKATGRLAILPVENQKDFYDDVSAAYTSYVERLIDQGEYDLELSTLNLKAKIISTKTIAVGKGGRSVFGGNSILELNEVDVLKKPLTSTELKDNIKKALEGYQSALELKEYILEKQKYFIEKHLLQIQITEEKRAESKIKSAIKVAEKTKEDGKLSPIEIQEIKDKIEVDIAENIEGKQEKYKASQNDLANIFKSFYVGSVFNVRRDFDFRLGEDLVLSLGVFLGFKIKDDHKNPYALSRIEATFAVLDSRKYLVFPLSTQYITSDIRVRPSDKSLETVLETWDSKISKKEREEKYIVTGNILQAFNEYGGLLSDYTLLNGSNNKGILMANSFTPAKNDKGEYNEMVRVPISKAFSVINSLKVYGAIGSSDDIITFYRRSDDEFNMSVPASKSNGGDKYYLSQDLMQHMKNGTFVRRANQMQGFFDASNLSEIVSVLQDRFSVSINVPIAIFEALSDSIKGTPVPEPEPEDMQSEESAMPKLEKNAYFSRHSELGDEDEYFQFKEYSGDMMLFDVYMIDGNRERKLMEYTQLSADDFEYNDLEEIDRSIIDTALTLKAPEPEDLDLDEYEDDEVEDDEVEDDEVEDDEVEDDEVEDDEYEDDEYEDDEVETPTIEPTEEISADTATDTGNIEEAIDALKIALEYTSGEETHREIKEAIEALEIALEYA